MKLKEKGFRVLSRTVFLCLLAIGVPKFFFVMQSEARQKPADIPLFHVPSSFYLKSITKIATNNSQKNHRFCDIKNNSNSLRPQLDFSGTSSQLRVALVTNQMHTWGTSSTTLERLVSSGITVRTLLVPFAYQTELVRKYLPRASFLATTVSIVTGKTDMLFSAQHLAGCDAVCLDLQDTGVRTDGYVVVVYAALRAARDYDKQLIIIDHPNPLGGVMEGLCSRDADRDNEIACIPLRHGMTLGELALYMNRSFLSSRVRLTVVPLETYDRFIPIPARTMRRPFSYNITSLEACRCYSFLGVLGEVAPFDVALGTQYSFQALLLPEKNKISRAAWEGYRTVLKEHGIESRLWRYYSKRRHQWFSGVRLFIPDGADFSSIKVLMATLTFFKQRGVNLAPSSHIDQSVGSSVVRRFIKGDLSLASTLKEAHTAKMLFFKEAFSSCLYKPLPRE